MKRPKPLSIRASIICWSVVLAAGSMGIYLLSDDSRIQALACTGNYYYTNQQVYDLAGLSAASRKWLLPSFILEKELENDPLIEKAKVIRNGQSLRIDVQEKVVVGYYVSDGQNFLLTMDGNSIPIEDQAMMSSLVHFPLLANLSEEQMEAICEELSAYSEYISRDVLEKIAEIVPWSESYDPNMVKMVMQDGNAVFSSIPSLHMISKYQPMLTELQGENVCLVLDGENDAIDKISCDYLFMTSEERDQYRTELKRQIEEAKKEAEEAAKKEKEEREKKENEQQEENTSSENDSSDQENDSSESDNPEEEAPAETPRQEADDWQPSQWDWLRYSPSLDIYEDYYDGSQYRWDETIQSFRPL